MDKYVFQKRGVTLEPFVQALQIWHAHRRIIEIMCSKFHLDDLKTVGGV